MRGWEQGEGENNSCWGKAPVARSPKAWQRRKETGRKKGGRRLPYEPFIWGFITECSVSPPGWLGRADGWGAQGGTRGSVWIRDLSAPFIPVSHPSKTSQPNSFYKSTNVRFRGVELRRNKETMFHHPLWCDVTAFIKYWHDKQQPHAHYVQLVLVNAHTYNGFVVVAAH